MKRGRIMIRVTFAIEMRDSFWPINSCVDMAQFIRDKTRMVNNVVTSVPRSVTTSPIGIRLSGLMWRC